MVNERQRHLVRADGFRQVQEAALAARLPEAGVTMPSG